MIPLHYAVHPCDVIGSQELGEWWPNGWCAGLRIERSGFEPWPGTLCCVLVARHFTFTVPLSTQVYKWVLANFMPGVTLRWIIVSARS